jgi:hypothetical protein
MRAVLLLLQVIIPTMTLRPHILRLEVVVVQQRFHLLRASPLRVHSCRQLCAPTHVQLRWNEQALSVEYLYKFYHSGDMFRIRSRIYCPGFSYSQSGMPPMFCNLA